MAALVLLLVHARRRAQREDLQELALTAVLWLWAAGYLAVTAWAVR